MLRSNLLAVPLTVALLSPALAHTGVGEVGLFTSGVAHPLGGADHILAMVAVGLWRPALRAIGGAQVLGGLALLAGLP